MPKRLFQSVLGALAIIALPAQAVLLHGTQIGNSNLVTVDSVTGVIANVGALPGGASPGSIVQGLTGAASGNLLYTDGITQSVFELNSANGSLIATHPLPIVDTGGLSFDTPSNQLFSVNNGAPLVSQAGLGGAINFAFALINPLVPGAIGGDDNGRHFAQGVTAAGGSGIHEFNVAGAIINTLPLLPGNILPSGLAFDGQLLYASDTSTNLLYTLNPSTGAVLSQAAYAGPALAALAVLPAQAPVPATAALMGMGLAGLGWRRRKTV